MTPPINRIVVYTKKLPEMVEFYTRFFGFEVHQRGGDRISELRPLAGWVSLLLYPAAKSQKEGQSLIKLVFDVEDVEAFRDELWQAGIDFGPIHRVDGYSFANAKDPANNSISISSRAFSRLAGSQN